MAAGIGFLFNAKAVFVLAACAVFAWPDACAAAGRFRDLPRPIAAGMARRTDALTPYVDQVWRWPARYAASPVVPDPVWNGSCAHAQLAGFPRRARHRARPFLVSGAAMEIHRLGVALLRGRGARMALFPALLFILLPPMIIAAAGSYRRSIAEGRWQHWLQSRWLIPLVRFAPHYISLANSNDLALDRDSREASRIALAVAHPGSTLYVWGYRPEIFVYTGLSRPPDILNVRP